MISQFFVLSQRGDNIVFRDWVSRGCNHEESLITPRKPMERVSQELEKEVELLAALREGEMAESLRVLGERVREELM